MWDAPSRCPQDDVGTTCIPGRRDRMEVTERDVLLLHILGLPDHQPTEWETVGRPVVDGAELSALLEHHLPGLEFQWSSRNGSPRPVTSLDATVISGLHRSGTPVRLIARPAADSSLASRRRAPEGPDVVICTHEGPDSGRIVPLTRAGVSIGRSGSRVRLADPFLSAAQLQIEIGAQSVMVCQDRGREEWDPFRPLAAGSSVLRLKRGRPASLHPMTELPEIVVDAGSPPARPSMILQVAMAVSPLVIGVVMAVVTGLWYFLLFSSVSVLVAALLWQQHRRADRQFGHAITQRTAELVAALDQQCPDPGEVALASRSAHSDRFGIRSSHTGVPSAPPHPRAAGPAVRWGRSRVTLPVLTRDSTRPEGNAHWNRWSTTDAPAISTLRPGDIAVVTGDPTSTTAAARWVTLQLLRDAIASGRGLTLRGRSGDAMDLRPPRSPERGGTLVAWDDGRPVDLEPGWACVLLRSTGSLPSTESLNGSPSHLIDLHERRAQINGTDFSDLQWSGLSAETYELLLNEVSLEDEASDARTGPGPALLMLPDVPAMRSAADHLPVPLNATDPPLIVDLTNDGPHILVAGTTGSGKSELILTILTGLAAAHGPAEVSFILLDFKGGSSFSVLGTLPHTMSVETNLTDSVSLRTLDALRTELRRREELFLAAGVPDYPSFRRTHPEVLLPRLVVAVDELRVLVDEHPRASELLMRLAATGRSLGFHLLLATQRAQGAVGPDVRSNLGSTICLRTASDQESWDLLGAADAARIPADQPGRALLRRSGGPLEDFRASRFASLQAAPALRPGVGSPATDHAGIADWNEVVRHLASLCRIGSLQVPDPVVLPDLPERWSEIFPVEAAERRPGTVRLCLVDNTQVRRQDPLLWHPFDDGPVAWIGTEGGGVHESARAVLNQVQEARAQWGATHLVVLDGGQWLQAAPPPEPAHERSEDLWLSTGQLGPDDLGRALSRIDEWLADDERVLVLATQWGRLAGQRIAGTFETFEERVATLVRDSSTSRLCIAVFGGRELAGGRLLGLIPHRFHIPCGTTAEHRMVWPTLIGVRELPGRAVLINPDHPAPGVAVQLASPPADHGGP